MKPVLRYLALGATGLFLAACANSLQKAEMMSPDGSAFSNALHAEYLALAKEEASEHDWGHSDKFSDRAMLAGGGNDVEPYDPANWTMPADRARVIGGARERLMAAKNTGGMAAAPKRLAHAQAMFDCWVEEQHENHQPKDIARCRDAFIAAMSDVEAAMKPKAAAPAAAPAPKKEAAPAPAPKKENINKSWVVYFDFDKADVTGESMDTLKEVAAFANQYGQAKVRIHLGGHTDKAGANDYNNALSELRVENVIFGLMDLNVEPVMIRSKSFGEEQPALNTEDGARERLNRRVEITVKNR